MKKSKVTLKKPGGFCSRVGNKYQADIPRLISTTGKKCDLLPNTSEGMPSSSHSQRLPIPWITNREDNENDKIHENKTDIVESNGDLFCTSSSTWMDLERESFLLGLYIFKKDFVLLEKFIGTDKEVGDIQSFYYGEFYNSDGHLRWRKFKESEDKKPGCKLGEKIFTGWRQQKLLARLFSLAPKDLHDALVQSSVTFSRGKLPFKDYIFTLRNIVGLQTLVKAVGIGQARQDLTVLNYRSRNRHDSASVEPKKPLSNAYSSLKSAEIMKMLKGDFRLTDPRLRDLFWKAVWPHLLVYGWHVERVKDHKTLGLKHSLVFLVCDVHKFSVRLVKGEHYFDSVTDVLNKVASEPRILGDEKKRAAKPTQKKFTVVDTGTMFDKAEPPQLREVRNLPTQPKSVDCNSLALSVKNVGNVSEKSVEMAEECKTSSLEQNIYENGTWYGSSNGREPAMEEMKDHESRSTSPKMKYLINRMKDLTGCDNENSSCRFESISVERDKMEEGSTCELKSSSAVSSLEKGNNRDGIRGLVGGARLDGEVTSEEYTRPRNYWIDLNIPYAASPESGTEIDMTRNSEDYREKRIPIDLNIPYASPELGSETDVTENSEDYREKDISIGLHIPYAASPELGTETDVAQNNEDYRVKRVLIDLNIPYIDMTESNGDSDMKKSSSPSEETSQLPELVKLSNHVTNEENQRKSTRSRPKTKRALEALEDDFSRTKKRNMGNGPSQKKPKDLMQP